MTTTARLLDQAKQKLGITSDYRLAKIWNVTPQRIGIWRQGVNGLSDDKAIEICKMIGADPGPVLLELQAERARKSNHYAVAEVLESLLRKLGPSITAVIAIFALAPAPADAAFMPDESSALSRQHLTDNVNYAKYRMRITMRPDPGKPVRNGLQTTRPRPPTADSWRFRHAPACAPA